MENLTDSCTWICLLMPDEHPEMIPNMILSGVEEFPNTCLAGILAAILKNQLPMGVNLACLCIDGRQNTFRFCISGSISLEDLRTLCEQYQASFCHVD